MPPEKLFDFLVSQEFYQLIDKTDEFLKIDPKVDGEKDSKVTFFLDRYFRERLSGSTLKNYAKQILDFLSDEEINDLLNFIQQNSFDLREKLWQEEKVFEETQETQPETFEEKEKKYQEIMEPLIKKIAEPEKRTLQPEKEKVQPEKEKEFKTITFETYEEHKKPLEVLKLEDKPKTTEDLPETTIIIRKKEDKPKEGGEEILDLSKL